MAVIPTIGNAIGKVAGGVAASRVAPYLPTSGPIMSTPAGAAEGVCQPQPNPFLSEKPIVFGSGDADTSVIPYSFYDEVEVSMSVAGGNIPRIYYARRPGVVDIPNNPTSDNDFYKGPITLRQTATIKAQNRPRGRLPSETVTEVFPIKMRTPAISPPTGTWPGPLTVTISPGSSRAVNLRYTTDDWATSTPYTAPFVITEEKTVKARAYNDGCVTSNEVTREYVLVEITGSSATEGPESGGQEVTLTGYGFTGATGVEFGSGDATNVSVNAEGTQVTCTSPAGTGEVSVSVVVAGAPFVAPSPYSYLPPPTIETLVPDRGPTTEETEVAITGSGYDRLSLTSPVAFGATASPEVSVVDESHIVCKSPEASAGTVDVKIMDYWGQESNTKPFIYAVKPVITSIDPTNGPEAGGTPMTITGTGFTGAVAVYFYGTTEAPDMVVVDSEHITCKTPPKEATSGAPVEVATASLRSDPVYFIYIAPPHIDSIDPTEGPEEGGEPVSIHGSGFTQVL